MSVGYDLLRSTEHEDMNADLQHLADMQITRCSAYLFFFFLRLTLSATINVSIILAPKTWGVRCCTGPTKNKTKNRGGGGGGATAGEGVVQFDTHDMKA